MQKSPKGDAANITCACGKSFLVHPYRAKEAKYCSMECQRKYRIYHRPGKQTIDCEICGEPFKTWGCKRKRGNGRFCSKKCFNQNQSVGRPIDFTENSNGCFIVTSHSPLSTGYFLYRNGGVRKIMHRMIYEECFGEIPLGLVVRHKCDERRCINPEHLELGTQYDNVQDTVKRNRTLRGEKHPQRVIDEETAKKVKRMISDGRRNCEIQRSLGLSKSIVSNIKHGLSWKHIG